MLKLTLVVLVRTVVEPVSDKQDMQQNMRTTTIEKACLALGESKVLSSP